jgi:hypothetical protein
MVEMSRSDAVLNQHTCLIIPFGCRNTQEMQTALNKEWWKLENLKRERLYEHISLLVNDTNKAGTIGRRYRLQKQGATHYLLPMNERLSTRTNSSLWIIKEVVLFAFETDVCFLSIEISYTDEADVAKLIRGNYELKRINTLPEQFQSALMAILSDLQAGVFFEGSKDKPTHALVFSVMLVDMAETEREKSINQIQRYLFQARRSFNSSFQTSRDEYLLDRNKEVMQPFENSFWGVSLEGLCNIVSTTGDQQTNDFFSSTYFKHIRNTYFYLYILALHQRFTLLFLSIKAARLPLSLVELESKEMMLAEHLVAISRLKEQMVLFTLRSSHTQVSPITHQSNMYTFLRQNMNIFELMNELHFELEALSSMAELQQQKSMIRQTEKDQIVKELKVERDASFQKLILVLTTLFVVISTSADAWNLFSNWLDKKYPIPGSTPFYLFFVVETIILSSGIVIAIIIFVSWLRKLWRKSRI